ncbi:MAG: hypothetical protein KatS3mg057_3060 [Herpetosiphonaceae bacterium]|nr:MAG: hypothetical protein KatS3mg057_3060 [Herpetosiphonaceae bacterium]
MVADSALAVAGTLRVSDGQFQPADGSSFVDVVIEAAGTLTPDSGASLSVSGDWSSQGSFNANGGTVRFTGAAGQTISGALTFANLTIANTGISPDDSVDPDSALVVTGTLLVSDGQFQPADGSSFVDVVIEAGGTLTPDSGASLSVSGDWSSQGSFNANGGTISFTGAAGQTISGALTFANLTIANSGTSPDDSVAADSALVVTGTLLVSDGQFQPVDGSSFVDVVIEAAGTLTPDSGASLSVSGDWSSQGSFNANGGTVRFTGAAGQTISGALTFANLTIANTGISPDDSVDPDSALVVTDTLLVSDGQFQPADGSSFVDVVIEAAGTLAPDSGASLSVSGDWTSEGSFNANGGTVSFNSGMTQTLTLTVPTTFHHLIVGNGTLLIEEVSADHAEISGVLSNNGTIRKTQAISDSGQISFGLTGVTLDVTVPGSLSSVQIDRRDISHPNAPAGIQTGRYWTITPAGSDFSVDLSLPHEVNAATAQVCRYSGSGSEWDCDSDTTTAESVTRANISQLGGDWAVGDNPPARLSISKSASPDPVIATEPLTYTLTIANAGPGRANLLTVTDTLPLGVSFISAEGSGWSCPQPAGNIVNCTLPALAINQTAQITIKVQAPDNGGVITNSAEVSAANGAVASTSITTTVRHLTGLSLTKSATPDSVLVGKLLQYTLTVTNTGPSDAPLTTITDVLPSSVTFIRASTGCSESNKTVTCSPGTLTAGASAAFNIVVYPTAAGVITNTATVTSGGLDIDSFDNVASASTQVVEQADLAIEKSAAATIDANETLSYTLNVTNYGPHPARAITVTDALPSSTTFISAGGAGWSCAYAGADHTLTCTRAELLLLESAEVIVLVTVPGEGEMLLNAAGVESAVPDPDLTNNSASAETLVRPIADLSLTAEATASSFAISYTFTIINNGPSTAISTVLTATLPTGIEVNTTSPDEPICSLKNDTLICELGELAPGASAQVTLSGTVTNSAKSPVSSSATVAADEYDPDRTNNSVAEITELGIWRRYLPFIADMTPRADLVATLSLTPDRRSFTSDELVQITVTITNQGAVASGPFWVDLFINPSSPPTMANTLWSDVCSLDPCQGISWYVPDLAVGQRIVLTSTPDSYVAGNTIWSGSFVPRTSDLYVYVDVWNPGVATGMVREQDESNNRAELHGLSVTGQLAAQPALPDRSSLLPRARRPDDP